MGMTSWVASAVLIALAVRWIPLGRSSGWLAEGSLAVVAAFIAGLAATALDFGGWAEPDPRAAIFCAFVAATAVAMTRLVKQSRKEANR